MLQCLYTLVFWKRVEGDLAMKCMANLANIASKLV